MNNPFPKNTLAHKDFKMMSDFSWHCSKCEFKRNQPASFIRDCRKKGIETETDREKVRKCPLCGATSTYFKFK